MVKTNSLKAWFLAARPKTLSAAAVPVLLGIALAYRDAGEIAWVPALLCLFFAWVMQIDSNFVNDYFDFKHGNDDETRLGPKRACAEGWITLSAMQRGIIATTLLGCLIGLPLILFGGIEMIVVGVCCVVFCFLYTTCLSYLGIGDLLVLLFFGIVPVCCTYYLVVPEVIQHVTWETVVTSIACGLVVDTLLIVNNYRDYDNDKATGKKTLVVKIGKRKTELLYCVLGNVAVLMIIAMMSIDTLQSKGSTWLLPLLGVYAAMHNLTFWKMKQIGEGRELNKILGMTARNIFLFGIITSIILAGSTLIP